MIITPIKSILDRYTILMQAVDKKTTEVYSRAPEIPCKNKCFDCCKQLFPVSFVEAFYISEGLGNMERTLRRKRRRVAEKINEKILERNPFQFERRACDRKTALNTHGEFAQFLHTIESDCPALDPNVTMSSSKGDGACTVYQFRNHDCRVMGFSFDASANAIVGCFRFNSLKYLVPKLMDYGYRYPEKMVLDRELIAQVTGGIFTPNVLYYTTMCGPFLKDYATTDWIKFFTEKNIPEKSGENEYFVVIDI